MPYAAEGKISMSSIAGGVEISQGQYDAALEAILAGREITIDGGFAIRDSAPSPEHTWVNGAWVGPPPVPEPTPDGLMVNAERDRRINAGSTFTVAGYGSVFLTGRERDQIVLTSRLVAAQGMKAAGVTAPSLIIRGGDNINHLLTPDQMIELVQLGASWIEDTMKVSWDMKDATGAFPAGIPEDYANDIYWP